MFRIKEESGKKVVEEIREGSIVRRAEDDSLYKFLGVAKNTSSCEYEVVLMPLAEISVYIPFLLRISPRLRILVPIRTTHTRHAETLMETLVSSANLFSIYITG